MSFFDVIFSTRVRILPWLIAGAVALVGKVTKLDFFCVWLAFVLTLIKEAIEE